MIVSWRSGKAGFVGGSKTNIKNVFSFQHSVAVRIEKIAGFDRIRNLADFEQTTNLAGFNQATNLAQFERWVDIDDYS